MTSLRLFPSETFPDPEGPVVLIIMDGVGIGPNVDSNAVYLAKTPILDQLKQDHLYTQLKAHGTAVGMPTDDDMGNSEVGHNALGAGRVFDQGASLVQSAIDSRSIFSGQTWLDLITHCQTHSSPLHFIGLLSDGNVHSHIRHLFALLDEADRCNIQTVRLHILLDGRDVDARSALRYIDLLENHLQSIGRDYRIASGGGRMVTTMDRYHADWSIVERGWAAHVLGESPHYFSSARQAVESLYAQYPDLTDQYLPSFVILDEGIQDGDGVVCFNFRGDRVIELTHAFESTVFPYFDRIRVPNVFYAGMMQYDGDLQLPKRYLVDPPSIDHSISDYLCASGIRSFALSETQKYGHVTYFWNGNKSGYVDADLETYIEIKSDTIPFDQAPDMKAFEITDKAIEMISSGNFDFGRINYPNGDMVGHTGVMDATIQSIETTDTCVGRLMDCILEHNGVAVILADHGNADEMFTIKDGVKLPKTAHSLNAVPLHIVSNTHAYQLADIDTPGLANIAATLCNLLGFDSPDNYEDGLISI